MRNIEASFDVDNGPRFYLEETINIINALTSELVGSPLFKHVIDADLQHPVAETTHAYQDAHRQLYGYVIDGLDRRTISLLANRLQREIEAGDKRTLDALRELFPQLGPTSLFWKAVNNISEHRRPASHGVRSEAGHFPAFGAFTQDLAVLLGGMKDLLSTVETETGLNGRKSLEKSEARQRLPQIVSPPEVSGEFTITEASRMEGRTVERVEFGNRQKIKGAHDSEALLIYFTDGTVMGIETGSNATNVEGKDGDVRAEDFRVNFHITWVK
jgi:hypothetical protein